MVASPARPGGPELPLDQSVAAALREAFAGRVIASTTGQPNQPVPGGGKPQPKPQDEGIRKAEADEERADTKKPTNAKAGGQPVRDLEPKMTIAVHEPSNSLIVTAPQQLFEEAEKLAKSIDARAEQTVQVLVPINGEVFESVLQQFMGQTPTSRPQPSGGSSSQSDRSSSNPFRGRNEK